LIGNHVYSKLCAQYIPILVHLCRLVLRRSESSPPTSKDSDPKKCIVYVCGSARGMAKDVRNTFTKIGEDLLPEQIAQRFVAALQEKGA
jgi:hypothetical protein